MNLIKLLSRNSFFKRIYSDSLYRNSFYLMASTGIMSVTGFVFWIVVTRFYNPDQVGFATTLISTTLLLSSFSMLGLNNAVIRFLPGYEEKGRFIGTILLVLTISSIFVTALFFLAVPYFSSDIANLISTTSLKLLFVIFVVIYSLNAVTDSIFIASKQTQYIFIVNTIMSFIKLCFPVLLVSYGAYGIFGSFVLAILVALILSLYAIVWILKLPIKPIVCKLVMRSILRFSSAQYLSTLFGFLPTIIMPLLITDRLGPSYTAYYYMPNMITSMLLTIPRSSLTSLFAEGSSDERNISAYAWKALKMSLILLIPSVILSILIGPHVLTVFGKSYATEGYQYMRLVLISLLFVPGNYIFTGLMNIKKKNKLIVILNSLILVIQIGVNYFFLSYGLEGLGWASIVNQILLLFIFTGAYLRFGK